MEKPKKSKNKKPYQEHPAKDVFIKQALVDDDIVEIITWMNSFPGIFTRWSCQGEKDTSHNIGFYVSFYCDDQMDLIKILDMFENFVDIKVDLTPCSRMMRYRMSLRYGVTIENLKQRIQIN